ncbi:MAG: hypothetical protein ISR85_03085 [Kiritimatiellales bacterium]|nr:hypothetical protein [Kiritimatiellota bacterium]MBL7011898.1 hypothetical protein [Kiritimatiellales bacterium]
MGILSSEKIWVFLSKNLRKINAYLFIFFLMTLTGCSALSSYVFFVPQEQGSLFRDVERSDWITTNQGHGTIRPPLKSVNISREGKLTIYPVALVRGRIEALGPPFLSIIWIPEFMCPPLDSPNVLHFVYTGGAEGLRVESINDTPINQDCVKTSEHEGEIHYFLSISESDAKRDTLDVNISVRKEMISLEFKKTRTKNWFPLVAPL